MASRFGRREQGVPAAPHPGNRSSTESGGPRAEHLESCALLHPKAQSHRPALTHEGVVRVAGIDEAVHGVLRAAHRQFLARWFRCRAGNENSQGERVGRGTILLAHADGVGAARFKGLVVDSRDTFGVGLVTVDVLVLRASLPEQVDGGIHLPRSIELDDDRAALRSHEPVPDRRIGAATVAGVRPALQGRVDQGALDLPRWIHGDGVGTVVVGWWCRPRGLGRQ